MKKVLITGITGFAGSFLAQHLSATSENEIHGTYLTDESLSTIESFSNTITVHKLNLTDAKGTTALIEEVKPDSIYHLAALTSPAASFSNPTETITNNIATEVTILEAVKQFIPLAKVLIVSSADVYGNPKKEELPIDEETPLRPANPYAVSKIAQDFLGYQYFLAHKLHIIRVRPFNHIGPRQAPYFVVSDFAKQIVQIEKGKKNAVLRVGNLDAKRDFTDVRDMVKAYVDAIDKGEDGEVYNIGTGSSISIKDVVDMLLKQSSEKITVIQDESRYRPGDANDRVCDNNKFKKLTGWKAEIPLEQTLKDTLDYWRDIV